MSRLGSEGGLNSGVAVEVDLRPKLEEMVRKIDKYLGKKQKTLEKQARTTSRIDPKDTIGYLSGKVDKLTVQLAEMNHVFNNVKKHTGRMVSEMDNNNSTIDLTNGGGDGDGDEGELGDEHELFSIEEGQQLLDFLVQHEWLYIGGSLSTWISADYQTILPNRSSVEIRDHWLDMRSLIALGSNVYTVSDSDRHIIQRIEDMKEEVDRLNFKEELEF